MILYDGATGGLGRYVGDALGRRGASGVILRTRLEDREGRRRELAGLADRDATLLVLAARVSVPACEADPAGTFATNVEHTCAAVLDFVEWARRPRVVYVSTGHVYAPASEKVRLTEHARTAPRSVYAKSKLAAEQRLRDEAERRGFGLLIARVFGLVAPAQPPSYLLPGLLRRVRERAVQGVPGLSYVRDYLDARDVCDRLLDLARLEDAAAWKGEVINVCSGEGVTLRELLREAARALRPNEEAELMAAASEAPGRPDDVPWIVGDPSRLVALTHTPPKTIPLGQTIRDAAEAR